MTDDDSTVRFGDATISYDGEEHETFDATNVSLSVESSDVEPIQTDGFNQDTEYSASFSVKLEGQRVTCPDCGSVNTLPRGALLSCLTDEPVPCYICGYPLL